MSLCKILAVSRGYFARLIWAWTALHHSSMLLFPWQKLVNKSKWALTSLAWGLQNSSKCSQIVSKLRSSLGRFQDTYWSIPKSPIQATTFLHFWHSGSAASSHSIIFLHLSLHLRNLWYKPSLTVQSMWGPSMYGINMLGRTCGCAGRLNAWNDTSASDSCSKSLWFHLVDLEFPLLQ